MKRRILTGLLAITMVVAMALAPSGVSAAASTAIKYLPASYGVQIVYNGQALTSSTAQPFIVSGTTYVPLRMLMESFGDKSISWDAATNRVIINSGASQTEQMYMQQLSSRNAEITALKDENAKLKAQVTSLQAQADKADDVDLDDLEEELNDDYEDYGDNEYTITLSGDADAITLTIKTDSDTWDALSDTSKESFLQKICDDIWDEAEDADITGYVKEGTTKLDSFEVDADDDVDLSGSDEDIADLEDELNEDYGDFESFDVTISLDGDEDDLDLTVDLDEDDWDSLSTTEQEDFIQDICDDIWDEFTDAAISIKVKDGSTSLDSDSVEADEDVNF